ncbi:MAG: hypothetical protein IJH37_06710 [Clostridia bacterium]|nr:hypothetical protein [Clostridia bacterium]
MKMKKRLFYIFVLFLIAISLIYSDAVINYARKSIDMCMEIIIPTLFPFFVCSGLLIYSGFCSSLARAAAPVMRPIFNVAPSGSAAFVLGIISGFPLGAMTAADLYRCGSISKSEAERLMAFCNNSGPLFIIGTVGTSVYGRPSFGIILYIIHIISSILVGMIFSQYGKDRHNSPHIKLVTNDMPLAEVFRSALSNASKNILTVCFSIIFFSTLSCAALDLLPVPPLPHAIISGIFEFSTGVLDISTLDHSLYIKLVLTSLIVGFSGVCVHIQVMAVTAGAGLDLKPYIFGKLLHGGIAAGITAALLRLYPSVIQAFSQNASPLAGAFSVIPLLLASACAALMLAGAVSRLRRH